MKVTHHVFGDSEEYWTVQYSSVRDWAKNDEIVRWCTVNFGRQTHIAPNKGEPGWSKFRETFTINRQDDLTLFLLRWDNL